ncbi:MAG: hypothetical protein A2539_05000 [Elusimicrobia bacterium RIFOXYD2_FULL_34_15]|nr:MAG: hypothetical protein A2539_05000 [Elusimicrobia bacterium RIFOXYD2_FULL_34_15]
MFNKYKEKLIFIISLVISVISYYLICKSLSGSRAFIPDISAYADYFVEARFLKPEPFEKFCFLFGLIYVPLIFVFLHEMISHFEEKHKFLYPFYSNTFFDKLFNLILVVVMFLWGFYILKGAEAGYECWIFKVYLNYYWFRIALILFVTAILFRGILDKLNSKVFFAIGILIILATTLTQLHTNRIMMTNQYINAHFGMIVGAINQAANGKTILVNMFSQYGVLYPYAGAIFTGIFGHNILNISFFFLLLIFLSYLFMYMALGEKMGYRSWFTLFSLIALIGIAHMFYVSIILYGGVNNTYYQYQPIRTIFSALFLWFTIKYIKKYSKEKYIIGLCLCGLSFLWNFDTGVPIVISWLFFLIYNTLSIKEFTFKEKLFKSLKHLLFIGIALISTVVIYDIFAYIRMHKLPNWIEIVELQKLFVVLGFYMAPMRNFDLWNIVILIYVIALFSSIIALLRNKVTDTHRYYFFISLLGIGIFSYYQGRSLVSNLFVLVYPAVILIAFMIDDITKKYHLNMKNLKYILRTNVFRYDLIKLIFLSIIFVYGLVAFISKLPDLNKWVKYNIKEIKESNQPPIFSDTVDFIKNNKKSNETIIFSYVSDYLYCVSKTFSGLPFCSTIEAVTSPQWEKIRDVIESKKVGQIFYSNMGMPEKFDLIIKPAILKNYKNTKISPDGSIFLYELN